MRKRKKQNDILIVQEQSRSEGNGTVLEIEKYNHSSEEVNNTYMKYEFYTIMAVIN